MKGASVAKDKAVRTSVPDAREEAQAREEVAAMSKREFMEQYQQLARSYTADPGNPGSCLLYTSDAADE